MASCPHLADALCSRKSRPNKTFHCLWDTFSSASLGARVEGLAADFVSVHCPIDHVRHKRKFLGSRSHTATPSSGVIGIQWTVAVHWPGGFESTKVGFPPPPRGEVGRRFLRQIFSGFSNPGRRLPIILITPDACAPPAPTAPTKPDNQTDVGTSKTDRGLELPHEVLRGE